MRAGFRLSSAVSIALCGLFLGRASIAQAQDPTLPAVNLGLTNLQAGAGKGPGWYYLQYLQTYTPARARGWNGALKPGDPLSSSLSALQQVVYRSRLRIIHGRLGGSVLIPVSLRGGPSAQTVNPNLIGDFLTGPFLEWERSLRKAQLHVRLGINAVFPTGAFDRAYAINPGANLFRIFPHAEVTFAPAGRFSFSLKDNYYIFFPEKGSKARLAPANALNYAIELRLTHRLSIAGSGYVLSQSGQDSYDGDNRYYANQFGIADTRERVAGAGPGLGFHATGGVFIELKTMWEFGAINRSEGFRGTVVLSFPL